VGACRFTLKCGMAGIGIAPSGARIFSGTRAVQSERRKPGARFVTRFGALYDLETVSGKVQMDGWVLE